VKQTEVDPFMLKHLVDERDNAKLSKDLKLGYNYALYMINSYYKTLGKTIDEIINERLERLENNV